MKNFKRNAGAVNMTEGPVLLPFIRYTLPVVLSGMLSLLFNTVDMVVVGQFVGESAVAAVGSTTSLIGFITNFFLGISMGATVKLATDIGAGDHLRAGNLPDRLYPGGKYAGLDEDPVRCTSSGNSVSPYLFYRPAGIYDFFIRAGYFVCIWRHQITALLSGGGRRR